MNGLILFLAQGFGTGRIPKAPGTLGTLVGLVWFAVLNASGNAWVFGAGALLGLAASVWLCGRAERLLGRTDPGSVVLDEIVAFPLCFALPVVWAAWHSGGELAPLGQRYHQWPHWLWTFAAFRVFDIWKPWPVRQSQRLPGGWGVTADDVLAAGYVNLLWLMVPWS
ncbi:MAG: phosphatidylglycerophosphatase A [Verrucomicrobia bacterium]|nr:phosphatidylglycerophosphatase A [Verrucomicrobiota bacterium]